MPNLAYGTLLQIGGTSTVAALQEIQGLEVKANTIETTNLGSAALFKEFIAGFKEVSDLTVSGFFQPDDSNGQMQMWSLLESGVATSFTIVFPFGASWSFNGIVTGFKTGAKTDESVPFDGTIKISGAPSLNVTLSSGLSALTCSAGALSPVFANSVYEYTVTATTSTITVTPTATGNITVNGQGVASGAASPATPVAGGAITNVTVTEQDSGKVTKSYVIHVYHA